MKKLLMIVCMVLLCLYINAEELRLGKVKGTIKDSETKEFMEYAQIALFNQLDSTLVNGSVSNKSGQFEITNLQYGEYYIIANFMGYNKLNIDDINISKEEPVINLGDILLAPASEQIGTVEVKAEKPRVEYKIDKKIINVSQDINAIGGTAVDVLENTPSVEVDIEGNVSLRGSSNFTVLIDGKPSVLSGTDALRQIPATTIQNIEIITNPSAKYDPDGTAGIINIVMKRNILSGFNGILNTMVGTGDKYRSDLTLNYKTKKANFVLGGDWNSDNSWGKMFSERETILGDTSQFIISDGLRNMSRDGFNIKSGVDLYLTNKTTLSLSANGGKFNFDMGGTTNLNEYTIPSSNNIFMINTSSSIREGVMFSSNLSLQHKFDELGTHKLDFLAYYSNRTGDELETQDEFITDYLYKNKISTIENIKTVSTDNSNEYRFKLDYVKPINKSKIEVGLQALLERENEDYDFKNFDQSSNTWVDNPTFSSNMTLKDDVFAGYLTWSSQLGKLQYMTGLRTEYTDRYIKNEKSNEPAAIQRFDLFPTLHISYDLNETTQLMTSYSKRIRRPDGRDLDPFASYIDQYTIRVGNPNLKPEYTNSYELQALKRFGSNFASLDVFYRTTDDLMTRVQELRNDGIIYMTTNNINKDYSLGTEIAGNLNITKWFNLNTSFSLYNYQIKGEMNNQSIDRESTNYSIRANATFKISNNSRIQWMSMFRGPSVSAQGEQSSMFFSNLSYRQDFFKKKLTATVSVRDLFGTMKMSGKSYGTNFNFSNKMSREPRVFQITLSYNINNYKQDRSSGMETDTGNNSMEIEY